jgi:hypothetical protein
MADNTQLPSGTGGDTIRDLDRGTGAKTQVVQLDVGGPATSAESLVSAANPLPILSANEQNSVVPLLQQILVELRVITAFLGTGLNVIDDPDVYRNDPSFSQVN